MMTTSNLKTCSIAKLTLSQELPLPHWIAQHGMNVLLKGKLKIHPEGNFKAIRDSEAQNMIVKLSVDN